MSIFQLKYSFKYLVLTISKDVLSLISFDILFQRLHDDGIQGHYGFQFSGCWLILSVYIIMSFYFPFVRLLGVR
jgi:hypothetical protein